MSAEERPGRGASAADPAEIELKFDVLDTAAARALIEGAALDGLAPAGPVEVVTMIDRYVDTPAGALRRSGWVARLRVRPDDAGGTAVVLKTATGRSRGGLHVRDELEGPADTALAPAAWPASPARDRLLLLSGNDDLETTIVLDQRRRQRRFCDRDVEVEASLDRVRTLVDDRAVDRNVVLEVELKGGSAKRLEAVGEALARLPFLMPSETSKLDRSLRAAERARLRSTLPDPAVIRTPGVQGEDLVGEAGRKVLALHFARLLAREPGTRDGRDPEELHQMRVATRRMRAAWRVFGDAYDPRATRSMRAELREVADALGSVRDLDVLLDAVGAATTDGPDADGLQPFVAALRAERDEARRRLVRLLERPAYHRWVARSVRFLTTPGAALASVPKAAPRRIQDTAPSRIWQAYEQVRAYGELLRWADVPTLHQLRIAAKRLRYALEFVQETLGPETAPLLARVTALQDHLGLLNDADVAAFRARAFLVDHGATLSPVERDALGRYVVDRERELARLRRTIGRAWRGVDGPSFRRRLGRAVARL